MVSTSIQTVPSPITSAFSKPQPKYDVFLSFRGEDTRCTFTDHLYRALEYKRIITFRDDKELEMGKPISLELLEAIEKSTVAVIIFSKNYASSTWCLEELAKIVECRDRGIILRVLPIFYYVEPTDVRHQKNTFAEAFAKHEKRFEENPTKVQKWKTALTNVASLSGRHLKDGVPEANFIQNIVEWIDLKLNEKRSNDTEDGLVGISSRVEEMISYLDLESTDVHFIGICEKSGMGKTTLARAVFDKILKQFEASSFLENVREESKAHGLKTLQERLLCDIGKGGLRVKDVHKGMQVISDILHNKKVLIVVDDVSERSQLETLVGKRDLFGKGSRIIVTTEDRDLLASYEIKIVYKARGLNEVEALQLFSLNAFHKPHCENDFLEYCNNFVEYAQRIPLVLKVLGSYLYTRTKNEWESALNQLRAIPHEKTTKKLRIAFDGLGADEKKLFLDIACFFQGEEKNRIADILESYFSGINPIKNLIDKSLITLVVGEKLWMHNLLQQMGWEIVSEASDEAGERSRLWHCDDVLDVLKNNTGTKHIEGMLLRLPPDDEEELNVESFSKMNKLRLLKICKVRLSCLSYLSNELCWLEWHDYPLESLPNSFQPGELVELIMHRSCLQQLPSEFSKLGKLKLIDLSDSQNLTRTPDFTGFSNIERLNFQGCTRLHELHPSVGGLKRLILLNLKYCKCLENLPSELNLESLKTLILSGCSRFKKFPRIGRNMRSLLKLYLDGTAIEELPPTIGRLTGLTLLNLQDCKNLKSFPSDIHSLTSLGILTLSGCKCQPPKAGHLLGLSPIGSSIGATLTFPRLILFLFLSFLAWRYTYLRIPIFATTALSTYCFHNARHPEPEPINLLLSNSFSKLSTLVTLSLSDCNLLALPDDPSCLLSIEYLNLSKNNFICLPDYTSRLSKLKILFLGHCSKLKSLPNVPLSTRLVSVQGCTALENYSNQVVVWTLGVAGFTIITCLGLAEDEDGTIAEVSLLDIHLLWQRYVKDQIHQMEGFCHVLPQNEIPDWFKHQRFGSFGPIPLPSNLFSNKNWKGIALCVIFVVPAHSNDVSLGEDTKYFHEFYCLLDKYGDLIAFKVPKETYVGSFGLWLYISHARFRKHLDGGSCFTPFIGTDSPDIEINMCGARILYKQDMGEFLQNLGQKIVGSPNDLRGELNSHSHSQLSRLYQVDWARNHLSDYIFPQIASPPRWFAYQNGPAIKTQLPADLHDHSRRPTPVTELLPSNETIQGECTSRETIFSNQVMAAGTSKKVIAAGTSKSSSQGSLYLGKISSSLECWLKHRPHLQDRYEGPGTFNQCLPQSEIPGWFKSENIARSSSVTIQLPLNLYENDEWMGFAFCAVFSVQKHPISVRMKDSGFSFIIVCHLKTNLGCMNPLYGISEEDVIISLHQRAFLWVSFIPSRFLSPKWSRCTSVEFSFVSDNSDVSALKCGVDLVYRQKLEFTRIMVQCITSHDDPFTSYERFPFYHPDQFSGSDGSRGTSGHYSYEQFYKTAALDRYNNHSIFNQCILQSEILEWFSHDSLPSDLSPNFDYHPSTSYNFCFPPSKIQDWFSHLNHGHSMTIDLPSNLFHDSNWMGLVLYASFSIHGDPNIIFSNLVSGKSHFLYCQCQMSMANVDDQTIAFSTNKEEITWLLSLGEFIWICYVPGEPFKNMLPHCSHIEASFVSDWPGVIVQNCALQLLCQQDQVQFEQELKHCNNMIRENRKLVCKQYHVDEGLQRKIFSNIAFEVILFPRLIDQSGTDETETELGQSDLLISQIMDDLRSATFSMDSSEEEAGKVLRGLLQHGASTSDSFETSEVKAIQYAASTLQITSQKAILIEKRSIKKLLDQVGDSEATKKKILKYLLYLLKYGNLVLGDQSGNTRVQHEAVASENRRKSSVHSQSVEVESHIGYGHREAQFDILSRAIPPEEFRCPISSRLMYDPVVIASGQTFERMWIQKWFDEGNDTCPKTKIKLAHPSLTPNLSMKDLISKWCTRYGVTIPDPTMKPEVFHPWEMSSNSIASFGSSMNDIQLQLDFSNMSLGSLDASYTSDSSHPKILDGLSLMSMQTKEEHKFQSHATINETDLKFLSNLAELEWESQCEVVEEVKRHLNYSEEDYYSLSSENFVEPLVKFLKDACGRRDIKAQKTGSRLLLPFVSKNRIGISYLREEAYNLLETFLNSEDTEEALVILEVLSGHKYCRAKILASGALTSIIKMLDSHSSFQERIIKILSNMSSSSDICPRIVSLECIPKLIPFFGDSTLAGKCAFILKNLCDVEEARVSIAETSGCIASVTALLETGSHEDQENAVTVLLSLCSQRVQYCQWVMEEGVIPALVDISINGNKKGRVSALELLRLLRDIEYAEDRGCSGSDIDASKDTTDLSKEKKSSKTSGFFAKIPMFPKTKK